MTTLSENNFTLKNRIKYYKIINNYISQHLQKDPYNCINVDKNNLIKIGSNIVLDKQIGSKSVYGLAFLSHYIHKSDNLIFATKIIDSSKYYNIIEYNILKLLTKLNIEKQICPHFPICYGALKCDDYSHNIINSKINLGKLENKKLIFIFSELANNNLNNLLKSLDINLKVLFNTITQIMISIMFFNKYAKAFHRDGHTGNFLYHKINPGGYFHYVINGIDYYIENLGYLWIIWDFGLIVQFSNNNNIFSINYDYIKTLSSINKHLKKLYNYNNSNINNLIIGIQKYDFEYDIKKMPKLVNKVIESLLKYTNNSLLTSLPLKAKIINKKPFQF
jgi:hypothetical protein